MNVNLLRKIRKRCSYFYKDNKFYLLDKTTMTYRVYKDVDPNGVYDTLRFASDNVAELFKQRFTERLCYQL